MKAQMLGYRDWAKDLHDQVDDYRDGRSILWITSLDQVRDDCDLLFAVGWSEMIPEGVYTNRTVLVLHPSPLPKYRGGSPIQNQIIAGETESAVTLFKLDAAYPAVDSGPIFGSAPISLDGNLNEIFNRIVYYGSRLVKRAYDAFQDGGLILIPQDESQATAFKRRKPEESEISPYSFSNDYEMVPNAGLAIHNKVRALQDPYPNAYVLFPEGRLFITQTRWEPNE